MAFLLPLAIPAIANVTTNIGIGVSNALQSTDSSVTFQLGKYVFSTNKGFRLTDLPYELREKIILMALAESRSLILPPPVLLDPFAPISQSQLASLQSRSPLHPYNPNYMSIRGEIRSANGYPLSSWRWLVINKEWWAILRRELWRDLVLAGTRPYDNFLRLIKDPDVHVLSMVQTLSLLDGFTHPSELYDVLTDARLKSLMSISILPTWPHPSSPFLPGLAPFPFGLQVIPIRAHLQILALGLPLDMCTNPTSRQHLRSLQLNQLGVSIARPGPEILAELWDLVGDTCGTLSIRYTPSINVVGHQIQLEPLVDPLSILYSPLRNFPHLVFYLPRIVSLAAVPYANQPMEGGHAVASFAQRLVDVVAVDDELRDKVEIWLVGGVDGLLSGFGGVSDSGGSSTSADNERLWPIPAPTNDVNQLPTDDPEFNAALLQRRRSSAAEADQRSKSTWQRQTDLRLLGGLLGVRMESRKTS